jgi:hypothetical protein
MEQLPQGHHFNRVLKRRLSPMKQQFVVTHTIRETEIPALYYLPSLTAAPNTLLNYEICNSTAAYKCKYYN